MGSYILTLPFEIIAQIFVFCLPPEDDALPWRTEAPLLLAGICRHWRDAAMATHELWNTVHLSLRPRSVLKVAPLLDFWIPRAGNLPLSMSLIYKGAEWNLEVTDPEAPQRKLEALLKEYAPHWTSIELMPPFPTRALLASPDKDLASLKRLVLRYGPWAPSGNQLARGFSQAPRLRELHMISGSPTILALPWEQLTTLRLDNSAPVECVRTLALVPNLVNFTATIWTASPAPSIPPLTRLESLTFNLSHTRGPALLNSLTLPALHHLDLDIEDVREITSVTSLTTRSPCFLRSLSIRVGTHWTADYFLQLFSALDLLEDLDLRKAAKSVDIGLVLLKMQPHLLPNLRTLSIRRASAAHEDAELLADLLESRWNVPETVSLPVQMTAFRLDSPLVEVSDLDRSAVLRLARLRKEGMDIQIRLSFYLWFPMSLRPNVH
ncbi:hypothetical protein DFH08DRAFT_784773 [Mycena albidolilacea]|uniref:F-box domain-containing protein n=1 Tax=Mycena albidolilacea TaxID=1033008 RepID=A0AAD6ZQR5_9AGAR|nr:hypothetical protein DFH08DRAFT_784773 [Mycena albidolilacea]